MSKKNTAQDIKKLKGTKPVVMLTAYDFPTASILDASGLDALLVGDSLAMSMLGREDTLSLTMEEMLHHCRAVSAGTSRALVVGDMPFMSYEAGPTQAMENAGRFFKEGGVRALKLEGGLAILPQIKALIEAGMPVMGHLGLTPQRLAELGGYKVQGRDPQKADLLLQEARALEGAGCFALVLECIPADLAKRITETLFIPTIGIGAGPYCDGQILVLHDIIGLFDRFTPKFVKRYADLGQEIGRAVSEYKADVEAGRFPGPEHGF